MSNLYKPKLKGQTLGVMFGTFSPLHLGHYDMIMRAKRENDACLVVVSGYKGDRGDLIGLDLEKRFRYARELFADDENIRVEKLDESNIERYPDGWNAWMDIMQNIIESSTSLGNTSNTWYVGEPEYAEKIKELTHDNVRLRDRSEMPISATMIRENPYKYREYITRPFKRHFSFNVLVMGTASGGKTTLVRDLARSFGSPFTDEFARRYEEESNVRDEELTANDFNYLASGQFDNNRKTINSPSNNGLFIADTDVMVTKTYSKVYLNEEEHEKLVPLYDMLIAKQKWDLILVIPPITKYVDDGFRDMSQSSDGDRWEMHRLMMEEIKSQGLEGITVRLDALPRHGDYDKEGFYARYYIARRIIKEHVFKKYKIELI